MLIKGILLGLTLSFMVRPLLFSIVEASLEKGFKAGLAVGGGIWTSDVLYIFLVLYGVEYLTAVVELPDFRFWASIVGGTILMTFGIGGIVSGRKNAEKTPHAKTAERVLDFIDGPEPEGAAPNYTNWGVFGYWLKGFLVNTINPFTVFFWLGIASAVVVPNSWNKQEIVLFFSGMMASLISTDILKAISAKKVQQYLTPNHIIQLRKGIGVLMFLFGLALALQLGG